MENEILFNTEEEQKPAPSESKLPLIIIAILIVILISSGLYIPQTLNDIDASTENDANTPEKDALQHMQYFLDGDADGFISGYHEDVVDLGGGGHGDGSMDLEEMELWLLDYFQSVNYKDETEGKSLKDLFELDETIIWDYQQIMQNEDWQWENFGYTIEEGDYLVFLYPAPGSPFFDGFFAYYRNFNGEWLIVATD